MTLTDPNPSGQKCYQLQTWSCRIDRAASRAPVSKEACDNVHDFFFIKYCCNIQDGVLCDNSLRLPVANYYHKALHLGCFSAILDPLLNLQFALNQQVFFENFPNINPSRPVHFWKLYQGGLRGFLWTNFIIIW